MRFALTEEQAELGKIVRGLIDRRADALDLRAAMGSEPGFDEVLWRQLCEQIGVAALAVPEEYGGAGFTSFETHLVLEQLGRSLTPSPLLGTAVLTTQALLLSGDEVACKRLLPGLADGSVVGALAWPAAPVPGDGGGLLARQGDGWRVSGSARLVLGRDPGLVLAVAHTDDGPGLFEVDRSDTAWEVTPAVDPTLQLATVTFAEAEAEPLALSYGAGLEVLRQHAAAALTALQVGGAAAGLERTVTHLQERQQFGRPLGSFQALKHRVADLLVAVESSRSVSWSAAWAVAHGADDTARRVATAKAWCSDAFNAVAGEMIQLHGGIGITWEHDAHLYFKRAHATAQLFGTARQHRAALLEVSGR